MSDSANAGPVRQLRVVVEAEDFDRALEFYRDALGLEPEAAFEGDGGARVVILKAGVATLELSNPAQVRLIDAVEAEGRPSDRIRIAFEVDDSARATDLLVDAGAELVATPRETPWRSLNSRLRGPADLQLTLFQELETLAERAAQPGFTGGAPATPPGQQLHFITFATEDLGATRSFYGTLGWRPLLDVDGEIVFYQSAPGQVLGFFDARKFAEDLGANGPTPVSGVTLAHNVESADAVVELVDAMAAAGGTVRTPPRAGAFGGVFHAHVEDPNGVIWEIAHNPDWRVDPSGEVRLG